MNYVETIGWVLLHQVGNFLVWAVGKYRVIIFRIAICGISRHIGNILITKCIEILIKIFKENITKFRIYNTPHFFWGGGYLCLSGFFIIFFVSFMKLQPFLLMFLNGYPKWRYYIHMCGSHMHTCLIVVLTWNV